MLSRVRLMILVTGEPPAPVKARRGDYPRWIRERTGDAWSGDWSSWDVRSSRGVPPLPGPRDADGFIITGSSSSVTERAPWMLRLEELVRGIAAARRPVLGICFGHQIVAQALGGEVTRNPLGREIGTMRLSRLADDAMFAGLPRTLDVHGTHSDVVARPPPGAEILATTPLDAIAAFRVGDRVRGVQFHPEFDADVTRAYLRVRADAIASEGGDPQALLALVHDGARGRDMLRSFASIVASLAATAS
jgi:GMP synthase (glutamine-hydrolysing)